MTKSIIILSSLGSFLLLGCTNGSGQHQERPRTLDISSFGDYWYQGNAEITSYDLDQARYGGIHTGDAVLIFVTEDFSKSKQVKLDNPAQSPEDAQKVLKLNFTKKFLTGIYPYSIMRSVFAPVDGTPVLKTTFSSQEWCGQTFAQINRKADSLQLYSYSYFESEGDMNKNMAAVPLEDALWNMVRLDPEALPQGEFDMLPSLEYLRLRHKPEQAYTAEGELINQGKTSEYHLSYPDLGRQLVIYFETAFPHRISGWDEVFTSGFGAQSQTLTTRARARERIMIDYWNKNAVDDRRIRQRLKLDY